MKILDLSAGNRAVWFNRNDPRAVFLDRRESVKPTFVCDTTRIPSIVGENYDLVVFDPPHENVGANGHMAKLYGHSTRAEIIETIKGSGREAHRVTKENALMAFKWNDHAFKLDKVLALMSDYWEPLFGHQLRNMSGIDKARKVTQSYWVMLLRKPNREALALINPDTQQEPSHGK